MMENEQIQPQNPIQQPQVQPQAAPVEQPQMPVAPIADATDEEDDSGLPFPRARIVNLMKAQIGGAKQIRSEVKESMNLWMGELLQKLSLEMSKTQFGSVGMADFNRATKPYDMITDIVKDERRLIVSLEKLKLDADQLIREMQRFFANLKGEKQVEFVG